MSPRTATGRQIQQSFRNFFRRFVVLGAGLLILALPAIALAVEAPIEEDEDPFDRPGFYVGVGGSYQYNVFQDRIEDVIQDELEGTLLENVDFDIDDSGGVNALVGYRVWSWFALELEYEWIDEYDIKGKTNIPGTSARLYSIEGHTITANTKWIVPFWRIQPYLLLGGGVAISEVDRGSVFDDPILGPILDSAGVDVDSGTHTNAAGRAGLGIDLYITEHILVNAEATAVLTTLSKPDIGDIDDLNYLSFAAGLQYRF
jgi:opacity protein-like surface antigen